MEMRGKLKNKPSSPPKKYFVLNDSNNNSMNNERGKFEEKSNGGKNFDRKISMKYTDKQLNTDQNYIINLLVS